MIIRILSTGEYATRKAQLRPYLVEALEKSYRLDDSLQAVEAAIDLFNAFPVVVESDDRVVAFGVIELTETKGGSFWNIWAMAGRDREKWVDDFLALVESLAESDRDGTVKGVMLGGRPGWQKLLKRNGYVVEAVILKKEVYQNESRREFTKQQQQRQFQQRRI